MKQNLLAKAVTRKPTPEKYIERQVLAFLNALPNCLAWKNGHNGRDLGNNKWIRTRGTLNGVSDITCVYRRKLDGLNIVVFMEVKGAKGRLSDQQKRFGELVKGLNGYYVVVHSITDASVALAQLEV